MYITLLGVVWQSMLHGQCRAPVTVFTPRMIALIRQISCDRQGDGLLTRVTIATRDYTFTYVFILLYIYMLILIGAIYTGDSVFYVVGNILIILNLGPIHWPSETPLYDEFWWHQVTQLADRCRAGPGGMRPRQFTWQPKSGRYYNIYNCFTLED